MNQLKIVWVMVTKAGRVVRTAVTIVRASETVRRAVAVGRSERVREAARRAWPALKDLFAAVRHAWRGRGYSGVGGFAAAA